MVKTAQEWIEELRLSRHPEGGWYRRIYTSELQTEGGRPAMSSIHYLLEGSDFSALHRLRQDEQWNFFTGSPITVHRISPDGVASSAQLGPTGPFQTVVPAGEWFGATVDGDYALVGCTVAPAFDFADFELAQCTDLLARFPQHKSLIKQLTRT